MFGVNRVNLDDNQEFIKHVMGFYMEYILASDY